MSSSKSKKRNSMEMEESIDMDTDIPQQLNDPIEMEEEEEPTQGAPTSKSKGQQVVRKSTQRETVRNISSKSKKMAKEWVVSASVVAKYTNPSLLRMGQTI